MVMFLVKCNQVTKTGNHVTKMKQLIFIAIIIGLLLFYVSFFVYDKYEVTSYQDYKFNPPCQLKQLNDGWTQIENCGIYKLKEEIDGNK